jgi:hypothetical protein
MDSHLHKAGLRPLALPSAALSSHGRQVESGNDAELRLAVHGNSPTAEGGRSRLPSLACERGIEGEGSWRSALFSPVAFRRAFIVFVGWLPLGLSAAFAMASYAATLSDVGEIVGDGKTGVLEPEKWIGKKFPLLEYIDIGNTIREGRWLAMLYPHDCPKCQAAVLELSKAAQKANTQHIAIIAMPPSDKRDAVAESAADAVKGHLQQQRNWFAETPVVVVLQDARVLSIDIQRETN